MIIPFKGDMLKVELYDIIELYLSCTAIFEHSFYCHVLQYCIPVCSSCGTRILSTALYRLLEAVLFFLMFMSPAHGVCFLASKSNFLCHTMPLSSFHLAFYRLSVLAAVQ